MTADTAPAGAPSLRDLVDRLRAGVVGRTREIELVVAAIAADRHILIEGPPGTGKSTLLRGVAREMDIGFEFVEGNAELTPARLVGHFDPARVLVDGYVPDVFVPGPLAAALTDGALLYIEELNRVPEETLNVLITVMSERELHVPRLGRIEAAPGFRLVSAMNPFDAVGTARISSAVYDRVCRIAVDYQSETDELTILRKEISSSPTRADREASEVEPAWQLQVVELVRATREHPDLRIGSSVRGAIDLVLVANALGELRTAGAHAPSVSLDAALVALSGRVRLREGTDRSTEDVIRELFDTVFGRSVDEGGTDGGKAGAPTGATTSS
ncbi:MAG: MoxR family ATPase [Ilumatobacter sp.]|nr:MoxR family ATPase [Ilumatobacter sp.]